MTVPAFRIDPRSILLSLIAALSVFTGAYLLSSTVRALSKVAIAILGFAIGVVSYQIATGGI